MTWALVKPTAGYMTLSRLLRLTFLPWISTSERDGMGVGFRPAGICCQQTSPSANHARAARNSPNAPYRHAIKGWGSDEGKPLPVSTSTPPQFPPEQEALFREVLLLLNEKHVPYAVSGAFALHAHTGIWRDTKDLDLFLTAEAAARARQVLQEDGFEIEITDPVWLSKARRDDFYVDLITGMSNGIVTVDDSWIEGSARAKIPGIQTRVLAAEELIASKMFVLFRERYDGADIAHVIHGTRGRLDWDRLMHLAGQHWELLFYAMIMFKYIYPSKTEFIPREIWESMLERTKQAIESPDPKAKFRGSLLDERMFAIDVAEWGMNDLLGESRKRREGEIEKETSEQQPADDRGLVA